MIRFLTAAFMLLGSALVSAAEIPVPAAPTIGARSYLLIDFDSGRRLVEHETATRVDPASITKLMTSYAVFKELANGDLTYDDEVRISNKAWRTEGSRSFVEVNTKVRVEDLLRGMIIQSGNDATVALAEHVAGSEETFATLMNQYAQTLGMSDTHYVNATGLPHEDHYTTANDTAMLANAIIREFPEYYPLYAEKEFTYNGILQHNRNNLLWRDPAVDGLKTGHTEAAGYCLVSSARREGMRLIAVVMGADSEVARADQSQSLLSYGFRFFETHRLYEAGEIKGALRVWKGQQDEVGLATSRDVWVTIPRNSYKRLTAQLNVRSAAVAPITTDQEWGRLRVMLGEDAVVDEPLFAVSEVEKGGFWDRTSDGVRMWFDGLFSDD